MVEFEKSEDQNKDVTRDQKLVVIAGGGTGGHIYPGLAIARALVRRGLRVEWVGARGGLEEKIVPREGLPLHLIAIGKLHSSIGLVARIKTVIGMPFAFFQALALCWRLRPMAVLGVGGFASGPFLFVAALLRRRTLIWEPNAHAGLTNKLLSRLVDECLIVFEEARSGLRGPPARVVGLPVRESIARIGASRGDSVSAPSSTAGPLRVLVFGGSQGARAINKVVSAAVIEQQDWLNGVEIIHQTGRLDFSAIHSSYEQAGLLADRPGRHSIQCLEYLHDMDERYRWADIVICRSGASTVAEISAAGKAAVFVPLPTASDNHQLKNAQVLERAGAARVIEQNDFTPARFRSTIAEFKSNRSAIIELGERAHKFASANADDVIAKIVSGEKCE